MTESRCRGCNRKMLWAVDENGKAIPLDLVAPVYLVLHDGDRVVAKRAMDANGVHLALVSHFVTCAKREQFKRPR